MSSPKMSNVVTVPGCVAPSLGSRLLLFQLKVGRRKNKVSYDAGLGNSSDAYLL